MINTCAGQSMLKPQASAGPNAAAPLSAEHSQASQSKTPPGQGSTVMCAVDTHGHISFLRRARQVSNRVNLLHTPCPRTTVSSTTRVNPPSSCRSKASGGPAFHTIEQFQTSTTFPSQCFTCKEHNESQGLPMERERRTSYNFTLLAMAHLWIAVVRSAGTVSIRL